MPDALRFAEAAWQHIELLPARTVMSMSLFGGGGSPGVPGEGGDGIPGSGHTESNSATFNHVDIESTGTPGPTGSAHPGN